MPGEPGCLLVRSACIPESDCKSSMRLVLRTVKEQASPVVDNMKGSAKAEIRTVRADVPVQSHFVAKVNDGRGNVLAELNDIRIWHLI